MNDLKQIAKDIEDNIENTFDEFKVEGLKDGRLLVTETRGYDWSILFYITEDNVNVVEMNYKCDYPEQSDENVSTFQEALEMASNWC